MPVQTTLRNFLFPDGAKVSVKESGAVSYTDLGTITNTVAQTLEYDENKVQFANAADSSTQIKNMKITGGFTLAHWDLDNLNRLGGGMFSTIDTAGTPLTTIPDQDVAAGWDDNIIYDMTMVVSSSDSTVVRTTAKPTLTSVTLDPDGTPEVLVEDDDYIVAANSNSPSGWSIQFISSGMATGSPKTFIIRIDYGTNTPIANTTLYAGSSTVILTAFAMRITHTDSNGLIRQLDLYSVDTGSGSFQFNFKGANEEGVEEIPLTYTAKLDDSLTDGQQLLAFRFDDGAQ